MLRLIRKEIQNPKDLVKVHEDIQTTISVIIGNLQGRYGRGVQEFEKLAHHS
jgi:hypothetical protein